MAELEMKLYRVEGFYRISLIALLLIAFVFASVLVYVVQGEEKFFFILSSVAAFGVGMGLLAGRVKIELRVNWIALGFGVLGGLLIMLCMQLLALSILPLSRLILLYAAVCEELGFRFGLQRFLARFLKDFWALVIQAGVFAVYHWSVYPGYTELSLYPLIAGLILGVLNAMTRDLTAPMTAHLLVNFVASLG